MLTCTKTGCTSPQTGGPRKLSTPWHQWLGRCGYHGGPVPLCGCHRRAVRAIGRTPVCETCCPGQADMLLELTDPVPF